MGRLFGKVGLSLLVLNLLRCTPDYNIGSKAKNISNGQTLLCPTLGYTIKTEKSQKQPTLFPFCTNGLSDIAEHLDSNKDLSISQEELSSEAQSEVAIELTEKLNGGSNSPKDSKTLKFVRNKHYSFRWTTEFPYTMIGRNLDVTPITKFDRLYQKLLAEKIVSEKDVVIPANKLSRADYLLVHTERHLQRLEQLANSGMFGTFSNRFDENPVSDKIMEFVESSIAGTYEAGKIALQNGLAMNLSGGFHHAFPDHFQGFCYLNDVAIAIRKLQKERLIKKAMIVDLDVHNGNGNAFTFKDDPTVHTFDINQANTYPFKTREAAKTDLSLYSAFPNSHPLYNKNQNQSVVDDTVYLQELKDNLLPAIESFQPDIIFYLNGADILATDKLGNFQVTPEGAKERDRYVIDIVTKLKIPTAVVLAGGYSPNVDDVVNVHYQCARMVAGK